MNHYAYLAFGMAEDRAREADRERLGRAAVSGRPSWTRRVLARLFIVSGHASADIARRLDAFATE
jgi:hypothetical protein